MHPAGAMCLCVCLTRGSRWLRLKQDQQQRTWTALSFRWTFHGEQQSRLQNPGRSDRVLRMKCNDQDPWKQSKVELAVDEAIKTKLRQYSGEATGQGWGDGKGMQHKCMMEAADPRQKMHHSQFSPQRLQRYFHWLFRWRFQCPGKVLITWCTAWNTSPIMVSFIKYCGRGPSNSLGTSLLAPLAHHLFIFHLFMEWALCIHSLGTIQLKEKTQLRLFIL